MGKKGYDPKLRKVMNQISDILTENDICAFISLQSDTHVEFLLKMDASWSVARVEPPNGIRIRSKKEDFESKEEQHRQTEATVGMIMSFKDLSRLMHENMCGVEEALRPHMQIMHPVLNPATDLDNSDR